MKPVFQLRLFLFDILLSTAITMGFGAACATLFPQVPAGSGAGWMLGMAGTGWVVLIIWHLLAAGLGALSYLSILGTTMRIGVLVLLPSVIAWLAGLELPIWLPVVNVAFSSSIMAWVHYRQCIHRQIPVIRTLGWFAALQVTAAIWVAAFILTLAPFA